MTETRIPNSDDWSDADFYDEFIDGTPPLLQSRSGKYIAVIPGKEAARLVVLEAADEDEARAEAVSIMRRGQLQ